MEHCQGCFVVYGHLDDAKRDNVPTGTPEGAIGIYDASIDHPNEIICEKQAMGIYNELSWSWYHRPPHRKLD